ncbi:MAG: hypothetical protein U9Q33_02695 [Campylobacterota bacterium]|nr:hypothetical protein [Campylobacterota bacterium]
MYPNIMKAYQKINYQHRDQISDIFLASEELKVVKKVQHKHLLNKLKSVIEYDLSDIKNFLQSLLLNQDKIHPVILDFYKSQIKSNLQKYSEHKLQIMIIERHLDKLRTQEKKKNNG